MTPKPEDLRIEAISRPPKGGQQSGAMPRGVKVTHMPTGLTASCESEMSQMRNRIIALSMIEWGLAELDTRSAASGAWREPPPTPAPPADANTAALERYGWPAV
jgi:protein subunit release factor A